MRTLLWPLARREWEDALVLLRGGALTVYPTETVFGIGVALSAGDDGIERVRAAKGSPRGRPFLVLVASVEMAFELWSEVPAVARILAATAWPGPLTLVGPARDGLPSSVLGSFDGPDGPQPTISVRVPGDPALRQLIGRLGSPLLSTSANSAGTPPPVHVRDLRLDSLAPDLFLSAESCPGGEPSTVLTTLSHPPQILRQGAWHPTLLDEVTE